MSSGCGDVLSLADLQTAKKHQIFEAEVITGKSGGVATGADIDYATNQVTGQTQKTLPAVLRDAGFSPVSWDFSTGGTLTVNDRDKVVYDPVSKTWYSYAGTLPVVVPASFNPVGNADWKPQTDPTLRDDLALNSGSSMVGFKRSDVTGTVSTTVEKRLSSGALWLSDFSSKADADHTAGVQAMFDACPRGGSVYFDFPAKISDSIRVTKPVTMYGLGASNYLAGITAGTSLESMITVLQTNTTKPAFLLVATTDNYAFGQYAIFGVNLVDMHISGPSSASRALHGIATDTSVNGGDYHIRSCTFTRTTFRYFQVGVRFEGIGYLNMFHNWSAFDCTIGFESLKGNASDVGGQTRFVQCQTIGCSVGIDISSHPGSFGIVATTLSEGGYGLKIHEETSLLLTGCELESNNQGGLFVEIKESNPNSSAPKYIVGNKFLTNADDIHILKSTTAFADGDFAWPMLIDGNALLSASAIKIDLPSGETGIIDKQFIIGGSNSGPLGPLADSQVSAFFKGADYRKFNPAYVAKKAAYEKLVYIGSGAGDKVIAGISVGAGQTLKLVDVLRYSVSATGVRGDASLTLTASSSGIVFNWFGMGLVENAEWKNTTGSTQTVVFKANDASTNNSYYIAASYTVE